ncbi:similar to Saccharomyces cerevisiae YDR515W SLF1 RNA binding protein that associates with polysomes [Maudiozyma saulgeensis]|uniref:Similar to Saccharomyces cerevisiae YDR515W SLF1 RNA binding protein that associates with polysomes n=1 Tax=Maudiozyma saulgeensis TaxID=1789683 RepID=A0A1X7R3K7_9SACH|nr:similar to Saccharomyces cerevisiae YDR515W SLF1 RNA binding protein that associates with polysomes [Kazachstania saulgeensis]
MSVSVENTELTNSTPATNTAPAAPATPISGPVAPAPAKEEQTFSLAPAPLPANSPWKPISNDIPVTNINVDDLESNRKKTRTPVSSTSTKWVPIKASITVSSGNRKNANNKKKSSHNNNSNTQKSNTSGSASSNSSRKKKSHHSHGHPHSFEKSNNNSTETTSNGDSSAVVSEDKSSETTFDATQALQSDEQKKQQNHRHQSQRRRHYSNTNNKNGQGNTNGQRNTFNRNNGQGNNKYHRHHQHNGHHGHYSQSHHHQQQQQMVQLQSNFYAVQPVMMAVNNIARQLEYYLSNDNLINDTYLRSKFSKDGYVPLTLLAQFYRVVNMSFGGDVNIILSAIREIVFNETATVDIAKGKLLVGGQEDPKEGESEVAHPIEPSQLDYYFIRAHDWEKWIPAEFGSEIEIEKVLTGNDMDEFMMKIIQVPTQSAVVPPVSNESSINEESTETTEENAAEAITEEKADGNVEEKSA